jgi:tetratricopeptide (TPR) repeat protein
LLCVRPAGWGLLLLLPSFALVSPVSAEAHGAVHEQIDALTQQINQAPKNAGLYVMRGELYTEHGDLDAALSDYHRAGQLNPGLSIVDLARGKTLFQAGRFPSAKEALDRYLVLQPHHTDALVFRARVLAQLGQRDASVTDYTRAIEYLARLGHPNPDYYFERARLVAAGGHSHVRDAIRGLDDGLVALGPLATLQLYAIELELIIGRTESALARLDSVAAQQSHRPEAWLSRRGEILEHGGRAEDARAAYERALAAIEALSPRYRKTRATLELEARLRRTLDRLQH